MSPSSVAFDRQDVAVIEALGPKVMELMAAIDSARSSLEKLSNAEYPGAGELVDEIGALYWPKSPAPGDLSVVSRRLEELRVSRGNQAVYDYNRLCQGRHLTVGKAALEILEGNTDEKHLDRVEALRRYAASIAPRNLELLETAKDLVGAGRTGIQL